MGLFETVQLELFEFMGFKKPAKALPKTPLKGPESPKQVDGLSYPVEITRKAHLRGIRFNVDLSGVLQISASKSASDSDIFSLLQPHQTWIEKQLQKNHRVRERFPQKVWKSGEIFSFSGKNYSLVFSPSSTKKAHIRFMENSFEFFYPLSWHELSKDDLNKKLNQSFLYFFKLKASEVLNEKVTYWSKQMNLYPKSVTYRNQKTRWGSCSSEGSVNLNWRLIAFDDAIQDYVIVHELAHLKHQDHSKNFWNLVEGFLPDRKITSKRLQENALIADCYSTKSELYKFNPNF